MPKGYPSLSPDQKMEILNRIKDKGERVVGLAREYGVNPKIIYNQLSRSTGDSTSLLELAKLKREHNALLKIVGELIVDQRLGEKNQHLAFLKPSPNPSAGGGLLVE